MHANVFITVKKGGKTVDRRVGHNVWVNIGREYLARMTVDPPIESARIKYMGFGIGGVKQTGVTGVPPISTSYPPGFDPNGTTGNEYDAESPNDLPIETLERPVRITGGTLAYPGDPADVWVVAPPFFQSFREGLSTLVLKATIDTVLGHILYGPFVTMPLSEAGLFLDTIAPTDNPYKVTLLAYHSFVTLVLSPGSLVEVVWKVHF